MATDAESEHREGLMAFPAYDEGVDPHSFHLGMCCAFIEVVGLGAKRLALSPPMLSAELESVRGRALAFAEEFGVVSMVDPDPLTTKLFNPGFSEGKQVMLFALDDTVFAEYEALKAARRRSVAEGEPPETEADIARSFGRLLSYSDAAIDDLLRRPRF